jgi:hypothetical protein
LTNVVFFSSVQYYITQAKAPSGIRLLLTPISQYIVAIWSWYSDGLDDPGSIPRSIQTDSGAHTASYIMGIGGLSTGLKQQGREANHTPHLVSRSRMVELYLHSLHMSS